jgi:hypothetical protein
MNDQKHDYTHMPFITTKVKTVVIHENPDEIFASFIYFHLGEGSERRLWLSGWTLLPQLVEELLWVAGKDDAEMDRDCYYEIRRFHKYYIFEDECHCEWSSYGRAYEPFGKLLWYANVPYFKGIQRFVCLETIIKYCPAITRYFRKVVENEAATSEDAYNYIESQILERHVTRTEEYVSTINFRDTDDVRYPDISREDEQYEYWPEPYSESPYKNDDPDDIW